MTDRKPKASILRARSQVGAVLRRYREAKELSLRELGQRTGIPWRTIGSLETGRCRMGVAQLAALTPVLGSEFANKVLSLTAPKKRERKAA